MRLLAILEKVLGVRLTHCHREYEKDLDLRRELNARLMEIEIDLQNEARRGGSLGTDRDNHDR